jgi:hypothetical protein
MPHEVSRIYAIDYLRALERKHEYYFKNAGLDIMDCVVLTGDPFISLKIKRKSMPSTILKDIKNLLCITEKELSEKTKVRLLAIDIQLEAIKADLEIYRQNIKRTLLHLHDYTVIKSEIKKIVG